MTDNSLSVTIKPEPEDDTAQTPWPFHNNEVINLLSDDEGDEINMAGRPAPTLGSPFEMASRTADDDEGMPDITLDTAGVQPTVEKPSHTDVLALQQKMLARFSNQQRVEETPRVASPPTPPAPKPRAGRGKQAKKNDAAAARFQKQKDVWLKKKRANNLTIEDEIEFMKASDLNPLRCLMLMVLRLNPRSRRAYASLRQTRTSSERRRQTRTIKGFLWAKNRLFQAIAQCIAIKISRRREKVPSSKTIAMCPKRHASAPEPAEKLGRPETRQRRSSAPIIPERTLRTCSKRPGAKSRRKRPLPQEGRRLEPR